jgi:hypothetical protein
VSLTTVDNMIHDSTVLLYRAFVGKTLECFGEDGFGKYGRSDIPQYLRVSSIAADITADDIDSPSKCEGIMLLDLDGYSQARQGHAITDRNLEIAIRRCLKEWDIDADAVSWGPIDRQGEGYITLSFDPFKLLDW